MLDEKIENVSCSFESPKTLRNARIYFSSAGFYVTSKKKKKKKRENVWRDENFDLKNDQDRPEITRCILYRVDIYALESGHVE